MSTLLLWCTIIASASILSIIIGFIIDDENFISFGIAFAFIIGILGFAILANCLTNKMVTTEIFPKVVIEKNVNVITVIWSHDEIQHETKYFDEINKINEHTKWTMIEKFNHYGSFNGSYIKYETPIEYIYADTSNVEIIQFQKSPPDSIKKEIKLNKPNIMIK